VAEDDIRLHLCFAPNAALIGAVRRFVVDFFERVLAHEEMGDRLGLVAHELLENAIKYSTDPSAVVSLLIVRATRSSEIRIQTQNAASPAHIKRLKGIVDAMGAANDAMAFYQQLMRDSVRRNEGSGLGLARIWAEGEMRLSLTIEDNEVQLSAVTLAPVEARYPPPKEKR
jgi:hypothetical protein